MLLATLSSWTTFQISEWLFKFPSNFALESAEFPHNRLATPPPVCHIVSMESLPASLDRATEKVAAVYLRTLPRLLELGVTWRMEETIRQYCVSISLAEAAIEELDGSDVVIVSEKTGGKYTNPAVNILASANKEARAAGQALGLVPKTTDTIAKPAPAPPVGGPSSFQKRG